MNRLLDSVGGEGGMIWENSTETYTLLYVKQSSVILYNNNESFLNWIVTWDEKWTVYDRCDDQLSGGTDKKHQSTFQSQTHTHGHRWSAACLIHYSFLNPDETITSEKYAQQINEMHPKPPCLNPALVNRYGPILLCNNAQPHVTQPTLQKLNKLGYNVLPHLPYSPDLSPTDYHFFKHLDNFLQGKYFHNQQDAENAFQKFMEFQTMDF